MIKVKDIKLSELEMRGAYCDALIAVAEKNDKICAIDADVQFSMGTIPFYKKFPSRGINCGIMEAHAVGFSAGMSETGMIPFFHAFGTFATRRVFDQVFLSCAYQKLNVKIIGGDAGVTATANGGTHMPFEDVGIMRTIPNITIIEPADPAIYKTAVQYMADTHGVCYVRSCRRKVWQIYDENAKFEIGKANVLFKGKDVAIIACGIMVYEALKAREILEAEGISASVIDMHTIKPLDEKTILKFAKECSAMVVAENHNATSGLGSAVAEVLIENNPIPMERVAVFESFGEVGTQDFLQNKFKLTAEEIVLKAKKAISRKK
ncbi:MAG: transketolase family protein [Firmicutes bacterium]|nr:transketolase family protein [Bacillota bacterium]